MRDNALNGKFDYYLGIVSSNPYGGPYDGYSWSSSSDRRLNTGNNDESRYMDHHHEVERGIHHHGTLWRRLLKWTGYLTFYTPLNPISRRLSLLTAAATIVTSYGTNGIATTAQLDAYSLEGNVPTGQPTSAPSSQAPTTLKHRLTGMGLYSPSMSYSGG